GMGGQADQLGGQSRIQHRPGSFGEFRGRRAGIRKAREEAEGSGDASLLQQHRQQSRQFSFAEADGSSNRACCEWTNRDGRRGNHLWATESASSRERICPPKSCVIAPHFRGWGLHNRDARIWRKEWNSCNGGE